MYVKLDKTFGFFCYWRVRDGHYTRGFVIKRQSQKLFSERYGYMPGINIGPLYIRGIQEHAP